MDLTQHYSLLLGLDHNWSVSDVRLDMTNRTIDIDVEYISSSAQCPECSEEYSIYDLAPTRTWRHLDTMQCQTLLHAKTPRIKCDKCKVKTINVPWASKHSRWTLLFEAFALEVMLISKSLTDARRLLSLDWHSAHRIMKQAVERGLKRREDNEISWLGMDEKSFRKGQNYISVLTDITGKRILDVEEGRNKEVAKNLLHKGLTKEQRDVVWAVAMDMSAPFTSAVESELPNADIVFDRFHVMKHLLDAVDQVRRKEHKALSLQGDNTLSKSKYLWLQNLENMTQKAKERFNELSLLTLQTSQAWYLKELFKEFYDMPNHKSAFVFIREWVRKAKELNLSPINRFVKMLRKHFKGIVMYFNSFITNAVTEGLNSKIQNLKANAKGFRKFENYRTVILFYCGKLNLSPLK